MTLYKYNIIIHKFLILNKYILLNINWFILKSVNLCINVKLKIRNWFSNNKTIKSVWVLSIEIVGYNKD